MTALRTHTIGDAVADLNRQQAREDALAFERRLDRVAVACAEAEAARSRGVCISGMSPDRPARRSEAAIRGAAEARAAGEEAWRKSPVGRAHRLLTEAEPVAMSLFAKLEDIRAALSRGDGTAKQKATEAEVFATTLADKLVALSANLRLAAKTEGN